MAAAMVLSATPANAGLIDSNPLDDAKNAVSRGVENVKDAAKDVRDNVTGAAQDAKGNLAGAAQNVKQQAGKGLDEAKGNVRGVSQDVKGGFFGKLFGGAKGNVRGAVQKMKEDAETGVDTETYKAGVGAKIEYSDIQSQSAADVVNSLKEKILPEVEAKLSQAASKSGSSYPDSIVQELKTVKGEIEALERGLAGGSQDESVTKSLASSIEQQVNALKANLGFD